MKSRFNLLFALTLLLAASGAVHAQGTLHGQLFLPSHDLPTHEIRFEIENDQGMHDTRYTDSNGRFLLDGMIQDMKYKIVVESDGQNWGHTEYEFIPGVGMADPRINLNPYSGKRPASAETASPTGAYIPDPKVADLRQKGVKALQAGKADEAESLLRQATVADPKYAAAFYDLGVVLMREGKLAEAEATFHKGLEIDSKSAVLLLNLGMVLVRQAKYADAIAPLREAIGLRPDQGDAHLQLGAALVETGQLEEAEKELLAARKIKGVNDVGLQLYLGKLYYMKKDYPKAIDAFNAYLKLAPENSPNAAPIRGLIQNMKDELAKQSGH